MDDTPFDCLESAQEYVRLLASDVDAARADIQEDIARAAGERAERRLDALHLAAYKLHQLSQQLGASGRILNDLRMLRRLLLAEPETDAAASEPYVVGSTR